MTRTFRFVAMAWTLFASGCYVGMAPPPGESALIVALLDDVTGEAVKTPATIIATTGEYRTWLLQGAPGYYRGAYMPGTYTITVEAEGYETAVLTGILVEADIRGDYAGLVTEAFNVRLTPLP